MVVIALSTSCSGSCGARTPQPTDGTLTVECKSPGIPISPLIYGVALDFGKFNDDSFIALGATARRWGGNTTSRYNWKLGNVWNTASDWYFRNVSLSAEDAAGSTAHQRFLETNRAPAASC